MTRAVFLDRDGTLTRDDGGYTHRVEDLEILPGVVPGLARLRDAGFELVIVTNQSGIGRGLFSEAAFLAFQDALTATLAADGNAIRGTFHCPHAPDAGCACRKPKPGLLHAAREALGLELARCFLIGDSERDLAAAHAAGCAGAWRVGPGHDPFEAACAEIAERA